MAAAQLIPSSAFQGDPGGPPGPKGEKVSRGGWGVPTTSSCLKGQCAARGTLSGCVMVLWLHWGLIQGSGNPLPGEGLLRR